MMILFLFTLSNAMLCQDFCPKNQDPDMEETQASVFSRMNDWFQQKGIIDYSIDKIIVPTYALSETCKSDGTDQFGISSHYELMASEGYAYGKPYVSKYKIKTEDKYIYMSIVYTACYQSTSVIIVNQEFQEIPPKKDASKSVNSGITVCPSMFVLIICGMFKLNI